MISADSGLVGSPERERQSAGEVARVRDQNSGRDATVTSAAPTYEGWRVTSLLMPTISPGDTVRIESRSVTANLIAAEVNHKGDNFEGDWHTELKLVDSATAAKLRAEAAKAATAATKRAHRGASASTPAPGARPTAPTGT